MLRLPLRAPALLRRRPASGETLRLPRLDRLGGVRLRLRLTDRESRDDVDTDRLRRRGVLEGLRLRLSLRLMLRPRLRLRDGE
jgi:hypothetical protein